jgi:integration host factor subunit alpha
MALTKADMAESLFNELGLNKREARELVELFFEDLRAALSSGEQAKLSGFGNFDLRDKNQRPGRNPKTGMEIPITARTKIKGPSRSLCWSREITTSFHRSRGSATSRLAK